MLAGSWTGTTESTGAMAEADDGEMGAVGAAGGVVAPAPDITGDGPPIAGVVTGETGSAVATVMV